MEVSVSLVVWSFALGWFVLQASRLVYNVFLHPLRAFPGPFPAGASTWWKTYIEVFKQESMTDVLYRLHETYGMHIQSYSATTQWTMAARPGANTDNR
jgi:hypothetical protein